MIDLFQDSVQFGLTDQVAKTLEKDVSGGDANWWMIIAISEFVVILILLMKPALFRRKETLGDGVFQRINDLKKSEVDMENVMNSITSAKTLYKELITKCHPDRFQDESMREKAEKLSQEISSSQRDYAKLMELKNRARQDLNIEF